MIPDGGIRGAKKTYISYPRENVIVHSVPGKAYSHAESKTCLIFMPLQPERSTEQTTRMTIMTPPPPAGKKEPGFPRPGKKTVIIIVILAVIVIIGVLVAGLPGQSRGSGGAVVSHSPSVPRTTPETTQDSLQKPVDFIIRAGSQEKCGLTCRQLTPTITNTGYETAHNVCISIVLYNSGGDLISLNGGPSITECIGDIASGESKSQPIKIEADCGFLASKCIRQTLILKTEATCDETTVQFPDRTIAV
jgi:hypothetical protein